MCVCMCVYVCVCVVSVVVFFVCVWVEIHVCKFVSGVLVFLMCVFGVGTERWEREAGLEIVFKLNSWKASVFQEYIYIFFYETNVMCTCVLIYCAHSRRTVVQLGTTGKPHGEEHFPGLKGNWVERPMYYLRKSNNLTIIDEADHGCTLICVLFLLILNVWKFSLA